jgi:hypothetical protein
VTKLAEVLCQTKITTLKCAAATSVCLCLRGPLTLCSTLASVPVLAVSWQAASVPEEAPLSRRVSQAT